MSSESLGRIAALSALVAIGAASCAPHQPTTPAIPLEQTVVAPAPTSTVVPLGTGLVPSLNAPAVPRGSVTTFTTVPPTTTMPVTTTRPLTTVTTAPTVTTVPFNQPVIVQNTSPVAYPPVYSPPTAQPRGLAPSDPVQYVTNATVTVAGRVVAISPSTGSFLLQTPSEGWTVVLPVGASAPSVATGRNLTVTGYAHRTERNQLLATSISP
jgi:hypothetical protein